MTLAAAGYVYATSRRQAKSIHLISLPLRATENSKPERSVVPIGRTRTTSTHHPYFHGKDIGIRMLLVRFSYVADSDTMCNDNAPDKTTPTKKEASGHA